MKATKDNVKYGDVLNGENGVVLLVLIPLPDGVISTANIKAGKVSGSSQTIFITYEELAKRKFIVKKAKTGEKVSISILNT